MTPTTHGRRLLAVGLATLAVLAVLSAAPSAAAVVQPEPTAGPTADRTTHLAGVGGGVGVGNGNGDSSTLARADGTGDAADGPLATFQFCFVPDAATIEVENVGSEAVELRDLDAEGQDVLDGVVRLEPGDRETISPVSNGPVALAAFDPDTGERVGDAVRLTVDCSPPALAQPAVTASPDAAGATATHTVLFSPTTSGSVGGELGSVTVDYGTSGVDLSGVDPSDLVQFGIDTDGDGVVDDSALPTGPADPEFGFEVSPDGRTLSVENTGVNPFSRGDVLVLEYADVRNPPAAGDYEVRVEVNGIRRTLTGTDPTLTITDPAADGPLSVAVTCGTDGADLVVTNGGSEAVELRDLDAEGRDVLDGRPLLAPGETTTLEGVADGEVVLAAFDPDTGERVGDAVRLTVDCGEP